MANTEKRYIGDGKTKSRTEIFLAIGEIFPNGKIPPGKFFDTLAGTFDEDVRETEFYQGNRHGAFDLAQFRAWEEQVEIIQKNRARYPEIKICSYPMRIQEALEDEKIASSTGFINLDTCMTWANSVNLLVTVMRLMKPYHGFGIAINSLFSTGWKNNSAFINPFETMEEHMKGKWKTQENFRDDFKELVSEYYPISACWYCGSGKSESLMGQFIIGKR